MINYTKFFLLTVLTTICGVTIAETPIEDNEYVIFYHNDVLGSPIAVSDGKGRVLWYENTDPYGVGLGRNSSDRITSVGNPVVELADSRIGYTGHEKDNTSGLTYMKARHYDPIIGRFYSNDPVGTTPYNGLFNRYTYVKDNPYLFTDPFGMQEMSIEDKISEEIEQTRSPFSRLASAIGSFFSGTADVANDYAMDASGGNGAANAAMAWRSGPFFLDRARMT